MDAGEVKKAEIKYDTIEFVKDDSERAIVYWTGKVDYDGLTERLEAGGVEFNEEDVYKRQNVWCGVKEIVKIWMRNVCRDKKHRKYRQVREFLL